MTDSSSHPDDVSEADTYSHADGTLEIVFARAEGKVLTVREYESVEDFEAAVEMSTYRGKHEGIASLPDPEDLADDLTGDSA